MSSSSIKSNTTYFPRDASPEPPEHDLTRLYLIDIPRITSPKWKPLTRTLFILGFFLPPVIPWLVCIAITLVKHKSAAAVTKEDQYWAFMCLFAVAVALLLAVGVLMCLAVQFRWFGRIAA